MIIYIVKLKFKWGLKLSDNFYYKIIKEINYLKFLKIKNNLKIIFLFFILIYNEKFHYIFTIFSLNFYGVLLIFSRVVSRFMLLMLLFLISVLKFYLVFGFIGVVYLES